MQRHLPTSRALRVGRTLTAISWLIGIGVAPVVAAQQDTIELTTEVEFKQAVADALDEYNRGHWDEAESLFMRAHELKPSARTLRGLGLTAYEARHYTDALRYLRESLSDERQPLDEHQRAVVQTTIARARLFVAHLRVETQPADAEVRINGALVKPGSTGEIVADVGRLDIAIKANGYEVWTRRLRMSGGQRECLRVELVALKTTQPTQPPLRPAAVAPLPAEAAGAAPTASDAKATAPADAEQTSSLSTWKWVAAGGAAAALVTGGALLIAQKTQTPDYIDECVNASKQASDCAERKVFLGSTLWTGSIVAFSIGAALAATSVTLFAIDARHGAENASALRCSTSGILGLACNGRF